MPMFTLYNYNNFSFIQSSNFSSIVYQSFFFLFSSQFYTTITYMVTTSDGYTVPGACFNPNLIQPLNGLCNAPNNYVAQIPFSYTASFIDLRGNYLQADLNQDNFGSLITSALQRAGISSTGIFERVCCLNRKQRLL